MLIYRHIVFVSHMLFMFDRPVPVHCHPPTEIRSMAACSSAVMATRQMQSIDTRRQSTFSPPTEA